ncbi:hypothetical protein JHK82_054876 [Glycine max]|nr:hypothetical protein JHK82_054876 [Glycine max]
MALGEKGTVEYGVNVEGGAFSLDPADRLGTSFEGPQESEVPRTSLKTQHLIELLCCLSSILCNFIRHPFVTKEFNKLVKFFKYIRFPAILPVPQQQDDVGLTGSAYYAMQTLHRRIVYVEEITLLSKGMTFSHWKKQPKVFREKNVLTHSLCQVYSPITEMNASKISRYVKILNMKLVKAF